MSPIFWIFIIVAVSLVLGPMMMMRPNPAQQKRERWRKLAAEKGIRFSIRQLPQQSTEQEKPAPTAVYFFPPDEKNSAHEWMLIRATYAHEMHFLEWWAWQSDGRPRAEELDILKSFLSKSQNEFRAVSMGSGGICVYWSERGDDKQFDDVINLLESLKNVNAS